MRWALVGYVLVATLLLLAPNPLGGNAVRLGALFGGPVLAAVMLARRPRLDRFSVLVLALALTGGLYWQVTASVSQIARSVGDPSTSRAYFRPAAHWLSAHGGAGVRVEVPPTANHWESAYLANRFELARGWLRQLDTTRDDIFYNDDSPLTPASYVHWLRRNAISYVALPDAPLDYSSVAERRLIRSAPGYLDLRWSSPHWRIYAVRDPKPLVDPMGGARRAHSGSVARASASTSPTRATSSSASTSPPTGRSSAAPAACSAAASGPSPAPLTPASSASPPTSPSAAPGTR